MMHEGSSMYVSIRRTFRAYSHVYMYVWVCVNCRRGKRRAPPKRPTGIVGLYSRPAGFVGFSLCIDDREQRNTRVYWECRPTCKPKMRKDSAESPEYERPSLCMAQHAHIAIWPIATAQQRPCEALLLCILRFTLYTGTPPQCTTYTRH